MQTKKTSYFKQPVESPSMYDEWGHYNLFRGFHKTTDSYAYLGLLWILLKNLNKRGVVSWISRRMIWYRWVHRSCDTVDFHHEIYCTLDPYVRKRDAQERWHRIWTTASSEAT